MPKQYGQNCPVAKTLELIGDRWTLLIVRDLLLGNSKFVELLESLPGIAPNILSERLKLLQSADLIQETQYSEHPPRFEYKLTAKGKELNLVIAALFSWGAKHVSEDISLVDQVCGHEIEVAYYCKQCGKRPSSRNIRPVKRQRR